MILCLLTASCADSSMHAARTSAGNEARTSAVPAAEVDSAARPDPIRLVFVGDVMLGRGVAPVAEGDPSSVFERLRPVLVGADLAFANLESPLTERPHLAGEFALEAAPGSAALLAGAGFDVIDVANNHATDGGPDTVLDTLGVLRSVGVHGVGGGATASEAGAPLIVEKGGLWVGVLAYDLAGGQAATVATAGVNGWDPELARAAVIELRGRVDVVVVGLHGGIEYLTRPDPSLEHIADRLADWGADVVWGHGAHVDYPVATAGSVDRPGVLAPGLGNALFDQRMPRTRTGAVLEVLVDATGVIALRTGRLDIEAGRTTFESWDAPAGDAAALDGDWWTPVRAWTPIAPGTVESDVHPLFERSEQTASSTGDVTGTGVTDLVVAHRRAATPEPVRDAFPHLDWYDDQGRTAHLAVYTREGKLRWGAAVMTQPVGAIAVCEGSMALGLTTLRDPAIVAAGAWFWDGFGFRTAPVLPGAATPTCADIDLDGRADPVLTDRSAPGRTTTTITTTITTTAIED